MGEIFGKYELENRVAVGGMAEVFLAHQRGEIGGFTKEVAIKRIFPHLTERQDLLDMFFDEGRIAASLNHPNIVQIYDLGQVDEFFYIAMEYVHGKDLRTVCERGFDEGNFLPRHLAARIIASAAAGLHYAHTRTDGAGRPMNIVHRDVSPQNILISMDGHIKVCDFGIAKAEDRLGHTQTGQFKGKFSYMSPEQLETGQVDGRSDIFTLGIVLYETTTCTRLFRGETDYETIHLVATGEITPPTQIIADYPKELARIVMRALEREPAHRYQTAEDFQVDLEDWLASSGHSSSAVHVSRYMRALFPEMVRGNTREEREKTRQININEEQWKRTDSRPNVTPVPKPQTSSSDLSAQVAAASEPAGADASNERAGSSTPLPQAASTPVPETSNEGTPLPADFARIVQQVPPREATPTPAAPSGGPTFPPSYHQSGGAPKPAGSNPAIAASGGSGARRMPPGQGAPNGGPPGAGRDASASQSGPVATPSAPGRGGTSGPLAVGPPARSGPPPRAAHASATPAPRATPTPQPQPQPRSQPQPANHGGGAGGHDPLDDPSLDVAPWNPSSNKRKGLLALAGLVLALGAIAAVVITSYDTRDAALVKEAESLRIDPSQLEGDLYEAPERVMVPFEVEPAGGSHFVVNGLPVEAEGTKIPLVEGERNEVMVFREGFSPQRLVVDGAESASPYQVQLTELTPGDTADLTVITEPRDAVLFVDGVQIGTTPTTVRELHAGVEHHVYITKGGRFPYAGILQLVPKTENQIQTTLAREDSGRKNYVEVNFNAVPRNTPVSIDGKPTGATPFFKNLERNRLIEITLGGRDTEEMTRRVLLEEIGTFELKPFLREAKREKGTISVRVDPLGPDLYVGNNAYGEGPAEKLTFPEGEVKVVVDTLDGRLEKALKVIPNEHTSYVLKLQNGKIDVISE